MEHLPGIIRSVLIANRGEIAVRVIRTCRRLGIRTVAVHSDADAGACHARLADVAVRIGPAPARDSYLDADAILDAARRQAVDAIHPGYGFLSENAGFVRRCEAAGFIFVGPSAAIVQSMGSKIEAKRIAEAAGVPTVPGYHGDDQGDATLRAEAGRIGFPLLIKASAGGGGRGMRRVDALDQFDAALREARAEASTAFGDDSVLLEKLVENPRHIEVQLFGDKRGNLVHLFERDCSVQRNNQKLLEETPAPHLDDRVRAALFGAALKLGRAIGYDSAGTVEFIMDATGDAPYFLEMNTRLQVEHPVTEMVTGVDLVEWQLIAAAGGRLPLAQDQIACRGHAIEARLTAERADLGFQPATGDVVQVAAQPSLRLDSGIAAGSLVGPHYDSLLAKAIAFARDRAGAVDQLARGLEETAILGLPTIQPFLIDALRHPLFADGRATTGFIAQAFPDGWRPDGAVLSLLRAAAAYLAFGRRAPAGTAAGNPWRTDSAFRVMGAAHRATVIVHVTDEYGATVIELRCLADAVEALVDGVSVDLGQVRVDERLSIRGGQATIAFGREQGAVTVGYRGLSLRAVARLRIDMAVAEDGADDAAADNVVLAPLPGVVTQIAVGIGDRVRRGDAVAQMEAMKLVHTLTARMDGVVAAIHVAAGATVPLGATLLEIMPDEQREVA